ncbi:MAG TPA: hypothetical protein VEK34_07370 [Methylocella sp.]|nr:hypothetical protein [Methylocella sp.]
MNLDARLNLWLFAAVFFLILANVGFFFYPVWRVIRPPAQPKEENQASCLKTSDFYSVHLTTYFLSETADAKKPGEAAQKYGEYCDRVPGPGRVVFTVDLMEDDARKMPVSLSLLQIDAKGQPTLIKALAPSRYPGGVLTLDVPSLAPSKYILKVGFGAAKTKDDLIEMPIFVGK